MPRIADPNRVPSYQHHKPSGQAKVRIHGRDVYLGPWNSAASKAEYRRVIAEWSASPHRTPTGAGGRTRNNASTWTIVELIKAYRDAQLRVIPARTFKARDGQALKRLRLLYGRTLARDFDQFAFKAFRESLVNEKSLPGMGAAKEDGPTSKRPLSRRYINALCGSIRRLFKWAVSEGLVPETIPHKLASVEGLRYGRGGTERDEVHPVADTAIAATLPELPPVVADMVRLQRYTGMRPSELCGLTKDEIDTTGEDWLYRPAAHKTAHLGKKRVVVLVGPAKDLVARYLVKARPGKPVFSPRDSEERRKAALRQERKTPLTPSQRLRDEVGASREAEAMAEESVRRSRRRPRDRYTSCAYANAIKRACIRAGIVPHWTPYQIRHAAATAIAASTGNRYEVGAVLGHADPRSTDRYINPERVAMAASALRRVPVPAVG
jgi:integrase